QAVAKGEPAIGTTEPHVPHAKLMSFEGMVPKGDDWRVLNVSDEERAVAGETGDLEHAQVAEAHA
ncbi:MAG: hypothetical protein MK097_01330, partial [Dechloromonas sp.]|nr:hypothetical protein [Dechloromonas sp.]